MRWPASVVVVAACYQNVDPTPPQVVGFGDAHALTGATSIECTATITGGTSVAVLGYVAIGCGTLCGTIPFPNITAATLDGSAMTLVNSVLGTPRDSQVTVSAQYIITGVASESASMAVSLDGSAESLHCGVIAVSGARDDQPVRDSNTAKGSGTQSEVTVSSAVGDLVIDTTGQGSGIAGPGAGTMEIYVADVDASTTLDNTAAGTAPGATPSVTTSWQFGNPDGWQSIASSLQPAL